MKKLLTVSVFAIMAVSAANADIASTTYVETRTGDVVLSGTNYVSGQTELTGAVRALDTQIKANAGDIANKVSQSDYDSKVQSLEAKDAELNTAITQEISAREDADSAINTLVGTLPEGATATTIVGYIQERTDGIATEGTVSELSTRVAQAETDIDDLESKVGNETVTAQISSALTSGNYLKAGDNISGLSNDKGYVNASEAVDAVKNSKITDDFINDGAISQGKINGLTGLATQVSTNVGDISDLQAKVGNTTVADQISDAITGLNTDMTGVKETVEALPTTYAPINTIEEAEQDAIDAALAEAKQYADYAEADAVEAAKTETTNQVKALAEGQVKTNTGAIADVKATADAAVQRDQVAMPVDFTVSEACKANGVICSLTIKGNGTGAVAQWEVVK